MDRDATRADGVRCEVNDVKRFARGGVHLGLLGTVSGVDTLLGSMSWGFCRGVMWECVMKVLTVGSSFVWFWWVSE